MSETQSQTQEKAISKIEAKRKQIFMERVQRRMNLGETFEEAANAIQREDYERLPLPKKFERLERLVAETVRGITADIQILKQNQDMLADSLDVNFKALELKLAALGMPVEKQSEFFIEARDTIVAERAAEQARAEVAARAKAEEAEKQAIVDNVDQPGAPDEEQPLPEGATVFGG